jgi:hypothetical protein
MTNYNGYRSWNEWNVSLWIHNDASLYRMALLWLTPGCGLTRRQQIEGMLHELTQLGMTKTPDGAPYTFSSLQTAMRGMLK